jgi:hypothetical protein
MADGVHLLREIGRAINGFERCSHRNRAFSG